MIVKLAFDETQEVLISMNYKDIDIDQPLEIKRDPDIVGIVYLNLRRDHPLFNIRSIYFATVVQLASVNPSLAVTGRYQLEALAENFYESVTDKL